LQSLANNYDFQIAAEDKTNKKEADVKNNIVLSVPISLEFLLYFFKQEQCRK